MFPTNLLAARGGGFAGIIRWFIMVVIYDICIMGIAELFGVHRFVACLIFLAILSAISFGGYLLKQRLAPGIED